MKYLFISMLAILSACASTQLAHDFDRTVDFTNYRTYAISQESYQMDIDDINQGRILHAVKMEMAAKGMSPSNTPDVIVDVFLKTEKHMQQSATTVGVGYGFGGPGMMMGMGTSSTQINYTEVTQGALFITMYEASAQQMVWQGVAKKEIQANLPAKKREQNINYVVKLIMSKYPPAKKK